MVVIYTHIDADGITSARVAYHAYKAGGSKVAVVFSHPFSYFHDGDVEKLRSLLSVDKDKELVVTDIPITQEGVDAVNDLLADGMVEQVTYIDHHPTLVDIKSVRTVDFRVIHDMEHCAATLALRVYFDKIENLFWSGYWAIVGAFGDVANDLKGSVEVINKLLSEEPRLQLLLGDAVYWDGRAERKYTIASMVASYLNTPRRMFFDKGAAIAYKALSDVETSGDPTLLLYDVRDTQMEPLYPYVALLQYWKEKWLEKRREIFKRENIDFYHLTAITEKGEEKRLGVAVIHHSWDIGGYVAQVKGQDIPVVVINTGLPYPYVKLSARGPFSEASKMYSEWDFSRFFDILSTLSGGALMGGGHAKAGAATAKRGDITVGEIMLLLRDALERYYVPQ